MLTKAIASAAVLAFALTVPAFAQEAAKRQQTVVQAQRSDALPAFAANFDRAARTERPAPLAPGSAEVP
jgi:hypothetical protein